MADHCESCGSRPGFVSGEKYDRAQRLAMMYRRALLLACDGDEDKVAYFVSESETGGASGKEMGNG